MSTAKRFNLRVYAIITRGDDLLLADENINGFSFTKFPGGGVELGEGLADALKRELMEEGKILIAESSHLYTTDFFQESAFNSQEQIVSVYYKVLADIPWNEFSSDQSLPNKKHSLKLYFKKISDLKISDFTFPIDQFVFSNYINA